MTQKTTLDRLKAFAKKTNREIFFTEEPYPMSGLYKFPRYKRTIYIPYDSQNNIFFVLYGNPYGNELDYTIYCGVYFKTNFSKHAKLEFRPKDLLDKLNPFLAKKLFRTENRKFDSKVVTTGNDSTLIAKMFINPKVQNLMLDIFKGEEFKKFSVNQTNVDFVPYLKDEAHFGVVNTQKWVLNEQIIEEWFSTMKKIRAIFENKVQLN